MIDKGANPFIVAYNNANRYMMEKLHYQNLSNLPRASVYFTTRPLVGNGGGEVDFSDPWFYRNGVFDGKFDSMIGQGAAGTVISGKWYGRNAAFKFVEIGEQKVQKNAKKGLEVLDEKLSEMISIQATEGSNIVRFYGHYR